jgi:predicted nucleic acid-binding protein
MAGRGVSFVDTNVLVYAHDASEPEKQSRARTILEELWTTRSGVLSTQVLQEFYDVATAKQRLAMMPATAREIVSLYSTWDVVTIDPVVILAATRLHEHGQVLFWDALIIEAARVAGAERILTEDLADGSTFDGVRIEDPFTDRRLLSETPAVYTAG